MTKFECHVTFDKRWESEVTETAEAHGFSVSAIDGDIDLGKGTNLYLTKHSADLLRLTADMLNLTDALAVLGIPWTRRKIELIVRDETPT